MTPAARLTATIEVLDAVMAAGRPADQVASAYFKGRRYIGAKDRRALADTVWRVLRRRARLEWWLAWAAHADRSGRALVLADLAVENAASATLFQGERAIILDAAERRLLDVLAGKPLFHHDMPAWVKGEYPEWIGPRLETLFGERLAAEMGAMRDEAPLDLRVNTLKGDRAAAIRALEAEGVAAVPTSYSPVGLRLAARLPLVQSPAWRQGLIEVQDEGSQLVALLTGARPGMAVCDYCAGAGGKTLALAAGMANKGRLVACDVAEWRIDKAQDRLRRAGVHNVTRRVITGESDKWIKRSAGSFDRVLVDAPCTGTGTWRRNPDAKWQMSPGDVDELAARQAAILASAARLVKPGGMLVYATCSLLPEEDEDRIAAFLAADPGFEALPLAAAWEQAMDSPCPFPAPYLRLTPLAHGTDGFFAAVLARKAA